MERAQVFVSLVLLVLTRFLLDLGGSEDAIVHRLRLDLYRLSMLGLEHVRV